MSDQEIEHAKRILERAGYTVVRPAAPRQQAPRRWGAFASKASMWATKGTCPHCTAEAGEPCVTRSGKEAGYPHSHRPRLLSEIEHMAFQLRLREVGE